MDRDPPAPRNISYDLLAANRIAALAAIDHQVVVTVHLNGGVPRQAQGMLHDARKARRLAGLEAGGRKERGQDLPRRKLPEAHSAAPGVRLRGPVLPFLPL